MRHRVYLLQGDTYQVIDSEEPSIVYFQGSISDCEAWIRLNEQGYM